MSLQNSVSVVEKGGRMNPKQITLARRGALLIEKPLRKNEAVSFRTGRIFNHGFAAALTKDNLVVVPVDGFDYFVEPEAILKRN
jgi:hypothetical protein